MEGFVVGSAGQEENGKDLLRNQALDKPLSFCSTDPLQA